MIALEHIQSARRQVRRESRKLDKLIAANIPAIRNIARRGKTAEERELARRWLAKVEVTK